MPCIALVPLREYRTQLRLQRQVARILKKEMRAKVKRAKLAKPAKSEQPKLETPTVVKAAAPVNTPPTNTEPAEPALVTAATTLASAAESEPSKPTPVDSTLVDSTPVLMYDGFEVSISHESRPRHTARSSQAVSPASLTTVSPAQPAAAANVATPTASTSVAAPVSPAASPAPATHRFMHKRRPSRAELINAESRLGSQIFGPIPAGHRREFFHDQRNIWIWYEGWVDEYNHFQQLTVRYEVRPTGVYKKIAAGQYVRLNPPEQENFRHAAHVYLQLVKQQLYNFA